MLEKTYNPATIETRLYEKWERSGAFSPTGKGEAFSMVIPPPNVTGSLHMGHALNNSLQDILVRWQRMLGKNVLWQCGTDHAGIATQMVVERQLAEEGKTSRHEMGRDGFVQRIWQWKEESGGEITRQLRRLGASCDWSRERFTMDEGLSKAVIKTFIQLYEEGLIYRDTRLVNWDPKLKTAISDLEVEACEVQGHFWHFKYPLENGQSYKFPIAYDEEGKPTEWEERDYISIATTRPETMLGDGAVAVHPSDKRYAKIIGKKCLLPLADRYIPIIADEYPDPDFGSGAVKITGAHDFKDYEVARRNDIPIYVLMDKEAKMKQEDYIPEKYRGLDRFEAREQIVEDIDKLGLLLKIEEKKISQPFGDRSGVVIEPMLTEQWYLNAKKMAQPAIKAVEEGSVRFVPENWQKTYFEWMHNIQPWCISRQLWWGHQIPAWFDEKGNTYVAESEEEAQKKAGKGVLLKRDEDVLDTWFSSALWPFSTLGWPGDIENCKTYYPTNVLVTGFDIIFFWVARMMMMGLHFMKEAPFREVYIHALVRDEKGSKMSKSKGNVIDPLELINEYGADALRFTLCAMAVPGRDIKLSKQRVEGYRNFATKLWNAARFCEMNKCFAIKDFNPEKTKLALSQWMVTEIAMGKKEIEQALEAYRFHDGANAIYRLVRGVFCDWAIEFAKPIFNGEDEEAKREIQGVMQWSLMQLLKLLHPFMPFITEELWQVTEQKNMLISTNWPQIDIASDTKGHEQIAWVIGAIERIRSVRAEMRVPAGAKLPLLILRADKKIEDYIATHKALLLRLARLESIELAEQAPKGSIEILHGAYTLALPISEVIDISAELARLAKEIDILQGEKAKLEGRINNKDFVKKAPESVVAKQQARLDEVEQNLARLEEAKTRFATLA